MKLVVVDALITMSRSSHNLGMLTVIILLVTRLIVKDCCERLERGVVEVRFITYILYFFHVVCERKGK